MGHSIISCIQDSWQKNKVFFCFCFLERKGKKGSFLEVLLKRSCSFLEKKTVIVRLVSYECFNIRNAIGTIFSQLLGIFPLPDYEQKKTKVSDFGLIVEWYKAYCEAKVRERERERWYEITFLNNSLSSTPN